MLHQHLNCQGGGICRKYKAIYRAHYENYRAFAHRKQLTRTRSRIEWEGYETKLKTLLRIPFHDSTELTWESVKHTRALVNRLKELKIGS